MHCYHSCGCCTRPHCAPHWASANPMNEVNIRQTSALYSTGRMSCQTACCFCNTSTCLHAQIPWRWTGPARMTVNITGVAVALPKAQ